jgi:glycosyltransferase involved in cell wall biosynthesis
LRTSTGKRALDPAPAVSMRDRLIVAGHDYRDRRPRNPRISVVVPANNEAANIREVLPYLANVHEVIVVVSKDDHESAEAARTALLCAKVIYQTRKGKGNALVCGLKEVTGDVIVTFDIDGSADPHEIPRFVAALTDGADIAKGSRFAPGGGSQDITPVRGAGNLGLNLVTRALNGTRFTDLCYGFNAFWADQLPRLDLPETCAESAQFGDGFEIEAMIICRFATSGAVIAEVPSYEYPRYHGKTNLHAVRDGVRVLWTILRDRFHRRQFRCQTGHLRPAGSSPERPGWMVVNDAERAQVLPYRRTVQAGH